VTPRGKIYYLTQLDKKNMLDKLLNRKVSASGDFVSAIYKCTGCGSCEKVCHAGIELVAFWEKIRSWLVENGEGPLPEHTKLAKRIKEGSNPYGEDPSERDAWWPKDVPREKTPDVIMFAGCTGSYRMKDIPQAGVTVLNRAGVKQNCLGKDEICCTSPALRTGNNNLTKKAAETVVNKADAVGAKDMVMTCSGCFKTVSSDFGNHYSMVGQNVYHFTQYVEKLIAEKKLPFNNPINAKVAYHDPCHLGRHSGVYDAPRNVLKKIKGVQLIEMERNRDNSRCCGAGGGYKSAFNDFAVNIAASRVKDAEEAGAEIIATACPFCVLNLTAGAKKIGSKVKVMDISQMLLKVTGPVEVPATAVPKEEPKKETITEIKVEIVAVPVPVEVRVEVPVEVLVPADTSDAGVCEEPPADIDWTEWDHYAHSEGGYHEEDPDAMRAETAEDSGELKLRRRLWRRGYRYRKKYGKDKITIAFIKARVAVFVEDSQDSAKDDRLRKEGWTVLRYIESDITDARKEAEEVIAELERKDDLSEEAEGYGVRQSAYGFIDDEVLREETANDSGELKLRRRLWGRGYRYRKVYGKEKMTIAFLRARVAVFVGEDSKAMDIDDSLRIAGWTVLRFREKSITDARKESEKVIAAIENNLNALMNDDGTKEKAAVDKDLFEEESEDDPAELKFRRLLWWNDYRYRRKYGREKITVAFRRAKVGAFISKDTHRRKGDDLLVKRGWTIMRFKESNITDAWPEASKVMMAVDRNLYLLSKGIIPEGRNITGTDLTDGGEEENTPDYRIRMILWKTNRYRRNYGEYNINIAFPAAKVAVFVGESTDYKPCDEKLAEDNWMVLRFKGASVTDGEKEAKKIVAAIEKNTERLEELEFEGDGGEDEEYDLSYLSEDTPEGRVRRATWNKRLRYRRGYSRYKIDMAFVKFKVAVFMDADGKRKPVDETLEKRGWTILRIRIKDITDGKEQADVIHKAVKESKKKTAKKKKKKPAKK
jgi:Fe-S oxidoreductase/very-short-patch-repair endonuclease